VPASGCGSGPWWSWALSGSAFYAEMCGRVAAVSGRPVFDLVLERLGPRMALANLTGSYLVTLLTLSAEIGGVALAIQLASSVNYLLWVHSWIAIKYPKAVFDEELGRWISDAEVAEIPFTAFTSRRHGEHLTARLIVRRVRDANPAHVMQNAQGELF
jgi:hypothetical protein